MALTNIFYVGVILTVVDYASSNLLKGSIEVAAEQQSYQNCNNYNLIYNPGSLSGSTSCYETSNSAGWDFWCNTGGQSLISGFGVDGTTVVVDIDCNTYTIQPPDVPLSRCAQNLFTATAGNVYTLTCDVPCAGSCTPSKFGNLWVSCGTSQVVGSVMYGGVDYSLTTSLSPPGVNLGPGNWYWPMCKGRKGPCLIGNLNRNVAYSVTCAADTYCHDDEASCKPKSDGTMSLVCSSAIQFIGMLTNLATGLSADISSCVMLNGPCVVSGLSPSATYALTCAGVCPSNLQSYGSNELCVSKTTMRYDLWCHDGNILGFGPVGSSGTIPYSCASMVQPFPDTGLNRCNYFQIVPGVLYQLQCDTTPCQPGTLCRASSFGTLYATCPSQHLVVSVTAASGLYNYALLGSSNGWPPCAGLQGPCMVGGLNPTQQYVVTCQSTFPQCTDSSGPCTASSDGHLTIACDTSKLYFGQPPVIGAFLTDSGVTRVSTSCIGTSGPCDVSGLLGSKTYTVACTSVCITKATRACVATSPSMSLVCTPGTSTVIQSFTRKGSLISLLNPAIGCSANQQSCVGTAAIPALFGTAYVLTCGPVAPVTCSDAAASCTPNAAGELSLVCSSAKNYIGRLYNVGTGATMPLQSCAAQLGATACTVNGLSTTSTYKLQCGPACPLSYIVYVPALNSGSITGVAYCVSTSSVINFDAWCNTAGRSYITSWGLVGTSPTSPAAALPVACFSQSPPDNPSNGLSHCSTILSTVVGNLYEVRCDVPCTTNGCVSTASDFGNIFVSCPSGSLISAVSRSGDSTNYALRPAGDWSPCYGSPGPCQVSGLTPGVQYTLTCAALASCTDKSTCSPSSLGALFVSCSDPAQHLGALKSSPNTVVSMGSCFGKTGSCMITGLNPQVQYSLLCGSVCDQYALQFGPLSSPPYVGKSYCLAQSTNSRYGLWCNAQGNALITGFGVVGTTQVVTAYCSTLTTPAPDTGFSRCGGPFSMVSGNFYELTCGVPCFPGVACYPSDFGNLFVECSGTTAKVVSLTTPSTGTTNYALVKKGWKWACAAQTGHYPNRCMVDALNPTLPYYLTCA